MNREFILLHWFYVLVMLSGVIAVVIMSRNPKKVPKIDYLITAIVPIWSGLAYMSMAIGQGFIQISDQVTFYARYIDWIVTTPLLLLSLCMTAFFYKEKKDKALIYSVLIADIIMILSGLIADLSQDNNRYIWFSVGLVCFFIIMYLIWVPIKKVAQSQNEKLYKLYTFLVTYLTIFWIGYPVTWIIGPSGLDIVSQRLDTYLFVILPIFSKVGFGLLNLRGLRKLEE